MNVYPTHEIFNVSVAVSNVTELVPEGAPGQEKRPLLWYLHLYLTPAIIAVGLAGNGLSFIVCVKTRLRHLSSSVYLAALCVSDSLFLIQLCAYWLIYVRVFIFHMEGLCQTFVYISYVSSFLSVWFVVAFTLERYIVCIYPLRKQLVCRVSRARIIVICLTITALVMYNFGAWTSGTVEQPSGHLMCIPLVKYRSIISVLNNIDTFITLLVPSVLIIFMNLRIVFNLSQLGSVRVKLLGPQTTEQVNNKMLSRAPSQLSHNSIANSHLHQRSVIQKSQVKITKMLVSVSSIFIILNLPSHVIRVYITLVDLFSEGTYDPPQNVVQWQQGFYFMYYTNFAVNFFLYSLCGQNFRHAVLSLFLKVKSRVKRINTTIYGSRMSRNTTMEMSSVSHSGNNSPLEANKTLQTSLTVKLSTGSK